MAHSRCEVINVHVSIVMYHNLFGIQMGLHLAKIKFPLAHMSAAWVNISQGLEGCFTRPDGADSALLMHHFPHTTTK